MDRRIYKLAIPNIISNITIPLVGMVDVALMGRLESPAFLGAIAIGSMLFTFLYAGMFFLRMGTSGITAQAYGASDFKTSAHTLSRAVMIAVGIGLLMIILQIPIRYIFIGFINAGSDIISLASEYFHIRIWAAPATLTVMAFSGWFLGNQNAKLPMYVALIINLSNIVFSGFFVLKLDMNVSGVAWGTVIAQYIGLLMCVYFYLKRFKRYNKLLNFYKTIESKALVRFFSINRDIFIRSMFLTGSFYYFNAVSASLGEDILAVNSLLIQFLWIFSYFVDGFAFAAEALVGRFFGAGDKKSLKLVIARLIRIGFILSLGVAVLYFVFDNAFLRLLSSNIELIELSQKYTFWIWILPVLSFQAFLMDGIFTGATKTAIMRNVMIVSVILFFIPLMHLLKHFYQNHGMWLALCTMLTVRGAGLWLMTGKIYKKLHSEKLRTKSTIENILKEK